MAVAVVRVPSTVWLCVSWVRYGYGYFLSGPNRMEGGGEASCFFRNGYVHFRLTGIQRIYMFPKAMADPEAQL